MTFEEKLDIAVKLIEKEQLKQSKNLFNFDKRPITDIVKNCVINDPKFLDQIVAKSEYFKSQELIKEYLRAKDE